MAGDLVNLRIERKRRARTAAEALAQANRVAHGLTKAQKRLAEAERQAAGRRLDGHVMGPRPDADPQ